MQLSLEFAGATSRPREITGTWIRNPHCGLFQKGQALPAGTGSFWMRSARIVREEGFI
jgi:hypothetical protein